MSEELTIETERGDDLPVWLAPLDTMQVGPMHTSMTARAREFYRAGAWLQGVRKAAKGVFPPRRGGEKVPVARLCDLLSVR